MAHAKKSPSGSKMWTSCPASFHLQQGFPNKSSLASAMGTALHFLASEVLIKDKDIQKALGHPIFVMKDGSEGWGTRDNAYLNHIITQDDIDNVSIYVNYVRNTDGIKHIEVALPLETLTGETGAVGTSDSCILDIENGLLTIVDLKMGRHKVDVNDNSQLKMYALAALENFRDYNFKMVKIVIIQPLLNYVGEQYHSVESLLQFKKFLYERSQYIDTLTIKTLKDDDFYMSDETCKWCKAKAICPAQIAGVMSVNYVDCEKINNEQLANYLSQVDMIRSWCDAIEQYAFEKLENGDEIEGFELRAGKHGNRKWSDEKAVLSMLEEHNIDSDIFFEKKFISPTSLDKLFKNKVLDENVYTQLTSLIVRPEGKMTLQKKSTPDFNFKTIN